MKKDIDNDPNTKNNNLMKYAKIIGLILGVIIVLGISYAVFSTIKASDKENSINVGSLSLKLSKESENGITINNASPLSNEQIFNNDDNLYTFSLENNGDYNLSYKIKLQDEKITDQCEIPDNNDNIITKICSRIDDKYIYYILKDITNSTLGKNDLNDSSIEKGYLDKKAKETNNNLNLRTISTGLILKHEVKNLALRIILNSESSNGENVSYDDIKGTEFKAHLIIEAEQSLLSE